MSLADVNPDVIRRLEGWSSKDTADHYASSSALKKARHEINRVGYEGFVLNHLYH